MGDDWRDNVGDYLSDDVWTVFLVGGAQVAGWSEGELVVHCPGVWDQNLDAIPTRGCRGAGSWLASKTNAEAAVSRRTIPLPRRS